MLPNHGCYPPVVVVATVDVVVALDAKQIVMVTVELKSTDDPGAALWVCTRFTWAGVHVAGFAELTAVCRCADVNLAVAADWVRPVTSGTVTWHTPVDRTS